MKKSELKAKIELLTDCISELKVDKDQLRSDNLNEDLMVCKKILEKYSNVLIEVNSSRECENTIRECNISFNF